MTVTPRELAHAAELRSTLVELNNAAIAARPFVEHQTKAWSERGGLATIGDATLTLERLDAAIADAGDVLDRSSS